MDVLTREHIEDIERERQQLETDYTAVLEELERRKVSFFKFVMKESIVECLSRFSLILSASLEFPAAFVENIGRICLSHL